MKNFTDAILNGDRMLHVSFEQVQTSTGSRFSVTAETHEAETISFDMKMDIRGDWNVVTPAPSWIKHLEIQFNQLLQEHAKYRMSIN